MIKKRTYYIIILLLLITSGQLLAQTKNIEISYKRNDDKTVDISYTKKLPGSYYLFLEFPQLENCYQSNLKEVIKSSSGTLLTLRPINNTKTHQVFLQIQLHQRLP